MSSRYLHTLTLAAALCAVILAHFAMAQQNKSGPMQRNESLPSAGKQTPPAPASTGAAPTGTSEFKPEAWFANVCGFCHEDGGRRAGKGPQLMDNPSSDEQLFNRIKQGKPGRMAAFGGTFTDDQIQHMIKYIRELKPEQ